MEKQWKQPQNLFQENRKGQSTRSSRKDDRVLGSEIMAIITAVKLFSTSILVASGLQHFAKNIPNGNRVPNPYPQGGLWAGVGHNAIGGGGELNPFGQDFQEEGFEWTEHLCRADSDGDGRSNGEELGDPDCIWTKGESDPILPALSHPGVVDTPVDRDGIVASTCSEYKEPNDVIAFDMKLSEPVEIDATRSHYFCEQIELAVPKATKLHKVKHSFLKDNKDIPHHAFAYLCLDGHSKDGDRVGQGPYSCEGAESSCISLADWAIGPSNEECLPPNIGEEFDFSGMDSVVVKLEFHYDNTAGTPQRDQSGFRVSLTSELRPHTLGRAMFGMGNADVDFVIVPQQETYRIQGICPSEATAGLDQPVYATHFFPHMHLSGRSLVTEQYRCGKKIGEVGRVESYEFDNQMTYDLSRKHIKILPGDALVTTCEYNTLDKNASLYGGDQTADEMCINFFFFYPAPAKTGLLQPCFAFDNGVSLDRVDGTAFDSPNGVPEAFKPFLQNKFALYNRNPRGGIMTDFSSDPKDSWAPCCETGTCDIDFLASAGEPCGLDLDCKDALFCNEGLCDGETEADLMGSYASSSVGVKGMASMIFPVFFLVASAMVFN
ncbi:DBH-like monooxygenase protein 2 [Seminavis robusta]|uniref:DBH-like monooxygenase protein 2 n=1 Tax=Seminavis robusta TaxID=568900 RepID=A0A9N8E877_9STRA|nr:DBH-like monooxygenase protein 2 [Seminavis robusta]|eukprot:Sro655_g182240.1 DBH-like monooxygenase protein 2 (606) ;mRNA; r:12344-14388